MRRTVMRRVLLLAVLSFGCAGRSERGNADMAGGSPASASTSGSTASAGSGAASGGNAPSVDTATGGHVSAAGNGGGGGGSNHATDPLPIGRGGLPLFIGGPAGAPLASEPDADGVQHFTFENGTAVMDISTHLHNVDLTALFGSIAFEARANRETKLLVATTPVDVRGYTEDAGAGFAWHGSEVVVTTSEQAHDLPFAAMQPLGPGEPRPSADTGGTVIHLILPDASGLELWLRNLELRP